VAQVVKSAERETESDVGVRFNGCIFHTYDGNIVSVKGEILAQINCSALCKKHIYYNMRYNNCNFFSLQDL
jgi:hypothetical protein